MNQQLRRSQAILPRMKRRALKLITAKLDLICDREDPFGEILIKVKPGEIHVQGLIVDKVEPDCPE